MKDYKSKVAILCGGKGLRIKDYTKDIPKALVKIGNKPILWHIMKIYSNYGFRKFVLCLGYSGAIIKEYFQRRKNIEDWEIIFAETGRDSNTGERIRRIKKYVEKDEFFLTTYGDGVSDINIKDLIDFHLKKEKTATITCVMPHSPFGMLEIDRKDAIINFKEKPLLKQWINGGFFVFNKEIFKYIKTSDVLETETFNRLLKKKQMTAYKFRGFWACMDTYKDTIMLNNLAKTDGGFAWLKNKRGN